MRQTPEQLLQAIENDANAIDFWPEPAPVKRGRDGDALGATWCCPFTDKEIEAAVEWHTDPASISEWLSRNRDYEPAEGDNWSRDDWNCAIDSMAEEAQDRLLIELRFKVSNHLRRTLGMVENKEPWWDNKETPLFN